MMCAERTAANHTAPGCVRPSDALGTEYSDSALMNSGFVTSFSAHDD